jgi:selenocysteine lyase/cysteine desulfurase
MNTANLAPPSAPGRAVLAELSASVDADPSFQNRGQFSALRQATREQVAAYLGADPDEIVLTRNTTESNNFVVQGLDLGPGDEVLLTEHNHPSNRASWQFRARREGFSVVEVPVPSPPPEPQALMDSLVAATTLRTRVIAYSHVTNLGGCRYPAREINNWARERGILTLVDGAQSCGSIDVDLHDINCDFYTASGHKWPCAPREVGVLYVRAGSEERLWPSVVSVGFNEFQTGGRMESLGQRDDATLAAFGSAMAFLGEIGSINVEARVAALTDYFKEELSGSSKVTLYTPMEAEFSGGVLTFHIDGVDSRRGFQWLYEERQIVCASSGVEQGGIRFSPHVYTSMAGCRRAFGAVKELIDGRVVL